MIVRAFVLALALAAAPAAADAEPILRPVDDAPKNPAFAAFRDSLRAAVERHDADALLAVVDSNIKIGFGEDSGLAGFENRWEFRKAGGELWRELGATLALGGTFDDGGNFVAPYVFSRWPVAVEAFSHVAITGRGVRVRARPALDAPVLARLSYAILPLPRVGSGEYNDFTTVRLPGGRTGYVADRYVRSPVGYRAFFAPSQGSWKMVLFLAGD